MYRSQNGNTGTRFNSLDKFQAFKHRFILFVILIFFKRPDDYMYIVFDITCIFI